VAVLEGWLQFESSGKVHEECEAFQIGDAQTGVLFGFAVNGTTACLTGTLIGGACGCDGVPSSVPAEAIDYGSVNETSHGVNDVS
jgi:hypothetical protein